VKCPVCDADGGGSHRSCNKTRMLVPRFHLFASLSVEMYFVHCGRFRCRADLDCWQSLTGHMSRL
jgi:hypothetical protein